MSTGRWGFSAGEWSGALDRLSRLLAETAAARATVTYGDVARVAFEGRVTARSGALMEALGDVDRATEAQRGVMIASLVVRADTGIPGDGYFAFASDELGRDVRAERRVFWEREVARVWDAYAPHRDADIRRDML